MTDPQKDEHIDELLSKLQGIFGKLSRSEEEESKQKLDIPSGEPAGKPRDAGQPASHNMPGPAPVSTGPLETPPASSPSSAPSEIPFEPPGASSGVTSATIGIYQSIVPPQDAEKLIVPTALFFPQGKDAEAKSLATKLEMMTPKFTKVAFCLRVIVCLPYDPKSEWKDALLAKATEHACQTLFVIVDRAMDDSKKKTIASECEAKNLYFHDVPINAIEKKAYYTDILLGLVFYFDTHRPPTTEEGTAA